MKIWVLNGNYNRNSVYHRLTNGCCRETAKELGLEIRPMWDSNPKLPDPYPMLYHLSYRDQAFSIPCFWTWTLPNIAFKYLSLLGIEIWEEKIQLYIYYSKQFSTQRDLVNLLRPRQNGRHFAYRLREYNPRTKVGIQDVFIVHGSISVARYEWQRI